MAVFEAHGFLLITFSPVSPDCLRTRCRRLLYTSNPYTIFFYGVPRRLWVNVGALPGSVSSQGSQGGWGAAQCQVCQGDTNLVLFLLVQQSRIMYTPKPGPCLYP